MYDKVDDRVQFYNEANREVAILCNHQRTVPKNFDVQLDKLREQYNKVMEQKDDMNEYLKALKKGKKYPKANADGKYPKTIEQTEKTIEKYNKKLNDIGNKLKSKESTREVALGTSKINYMDPRISVSWCKDKEVPIERIFPKTLRSKFLWAMQIEQIGRAHV